jgi:integrase
MPAGHPSEESTFEYSRRSLEGRACPVLGAAAVSRIRRKQLKGFLEQARRFRVGYYCPHVLCLVRIGLRLGEVKAVQRQDINLGKRQMEIRWGRVTDTKNRNRRRADMTAHLAETLQARKTEQKNAYFQESTPFRDTDYVFMSRRVDELCETALASARKRCVAAATLRQIRSHHAGNQNLQCFQ